MDRQRQSLSSIGTLLGLSPFVVRCLTLDLVERPGIVASASFVVVSDVIDPTTGADRLVRTAGDRVNELEGIFRI